MSRVSPPFPERVGWYELLAPIGAGGMATVYLGLQERVGGFQRQVAVKMIHGTHEADPLLAADLLREAKLAAKIRHPNVVPMLDVGEDPFGLFLVMDYIEGDNLAGLRRAATRKGERIPDAIGLRILTDALAGLHAAHELRDPTGKSLEVVHRDFSPQNILVGTDGVSRLSDFGIAKAAYTAGHTRTGKIKGKIAYMAPEQARGLKIDQRCDVWAAGVVAWEVLTGRRLHESDDEIAVLLKIINDEPPRLRSARPDLPEALEDAIASALSRELAVRCPTADQLRRRLLSALPVADTGEVAEYVQRIVGPKLVERHRKIAEIRRLRGRLGQISAVMSEPTTSPKDGVDATHADRDAEDVVDGTLTRVREDTTGATVAWKPGDDLAEGTAPPTGSLAVTDSVERSIRWALGDRRRRAAAIGVATGLGVGLVVISVLVISSLRSRSPSQEQAGSTAAVGSSSASAGPTVASPAAATAAVPAQVDERFVVRSNEPLASLRVAGREVPLGAASTEVRLDARPEPGSTVEGSTKDARKAKSRVFEGAREVALDFAPAKKPPGPRPAPVPAPPKPDSPFADNPYKKK